MKFKVPNLITAQTIYEFLSPFLSVSESMDFLKEHKIWRGLRSYGFLSVLLIILGVAFGIVLVYFLIDAIRVVDDYAHSDMDTASLLGSIGDRFNQSFLLGGSKYMILILMEIIMRGNMLLLFILKISLFQMLLIDIISIEMIFLLKIGTYLQPFILALHHLLQVWQGVGT